MIGDQSEKIPIQPMCVGENEIGVETKMKTFTRKQYFYRTGRIRNRGSTFKFNRTLF